MKLSNSLFYDRSAAAMNALSSRADTLTTQISTGKKLGAPSDDVVAYQRLQGLQRDGADAAASKTNLSTASSLLQQSDTALKSIGDQLQRASELAISARNGTLTDAARKAIATELDGIAGSLVALGNTTDLRGQPLFGGSDGAPAVVANADGTHSLSAVPPARIPIGNGQDVQPTETASRVFALDGGRNIIDTIAQFSAALKAGGDVSGPAGTAVTDFQGATDNAAAVQASLGARAARVDLVANQATTAATDRESARSALEDTDVTAAITELQKTMTVLQATQASFTKLSSLSLFDYLK